MVVGTPGRVLDHMSRKTLDLSELEIVVLDEADRMLDIGFRPDIEKILRKCPQERQTLLLSATIPPPVERLAQRYMHEPEMLDFSPKDIAVETIEQFYFTVDPETEVRSAGASDRREEPAPGDHLLPHQAGHRQDPPPAFRTGASRSACIHGDMSQTARDRVMRAISRRRKLAIPGGHRRGGPRNRRDEHLAHHQLRHPPVLRRLRPSRRPDRAGWAAKGWPTRSSRPRKATS